MRFAVKFTAPLICKDNSVLEVIQLDISTKTQGGDKIDTDILQWKYKHRESKARSSHHLRSMKNRSLENQQVAMLSELHTDKSPC